MQNDPRSHGLWERTAPPGPATPALRSNLHADVVVIGGGFTGLSTALHLAERGAHPVVLEAVEVGFGASGRNVGLVNAGMWVMPDDLPDVLGPDYGARLLDVLGHGPTVVWDIIERHGISCEATRRGTLHLAVGRQGVAEIETRARQWAARGAPVEVLDGAETARRTGSHAYAGALLDMRAGTIQPLAYVRGLARAAINAGAVVYGHSPVTGIEAMGPSWRVLTAEGSVTADWIVVATDAYTTAPWAQIRTEQVILPYFNLATRPLSDAEVAGILPGREGCWDTKEVLSSFRLDAANRLVFGSVGALRRGGQVVHKGWARRALARIYPQLGRVDFDTEWFGRIGMTDDALPRFHRFDRNVVGFCGYNGRGIVPGTVFGRIMAGYIMGNGGTGDLPLPVTNARPARKRKLREAYYEAGAQIAHLVADRF